MQSLMELNINVTQPPLPRNMKLDGNGVHIVENYFNIMEKPQFEQRHNMQDCF